MLWAPLVAREVQQHKAISQQVKGKGHHEGSWAEGDGGEQDWGGGQGPVAERCSNTMVYVRGKGHHVGIEDNQPNKQ